MRWLAHLFFRNAGIIVNGPNAWDIQIRPEYERRFYRRLVRAGSIGLGESYMDGWWTCADLEQFFCKILGSGAEERVVRFDNIALWLRGRLFNIQKKDPHKVADLHYNLNTDFFRHMLGDTMIYTCAKWDGTDSLDVAQAQKMDMFGKKLHATPGELVLDIGSGWGGPLAHLYEHYGLRGIGISIAKEQVEYANRRYSNNKSINFVLTNYRDFVTKVDHVISICMIEHVGTKNLRGYFEKVHEVVRTDGTFVLQYIRSKGGRQGTDPWLDKYIFPGGVLPTQEQIHSASAAAGFRVVHEEYFGPDYVKTLRAWYKNILPLKDKMIQEGTEMSFRMFEYYLLCCAAVFRTETATVGQITFSPQSA
jgi:cyclopropane-fatty-acyl-phospholipid synthase